ncbi:MAG: hypothetical protein ACFCU4_05675 [Puniceicoccaceae bacterium]
MRSFLFSSPQARQAVASSQTKGMVHQSRAEEGRIGWERMLAIRGLEVERSRERERGATGARAAHPKLSGGEG